MERGPHCLGCRGDRSTHWSLDCWILKCCVDERGPELCCEYHDFPCEQLGEWAAQSAGYTEALNRLHRMRGEATGWGRSVWRAVSDLRRPHEECPHGA